MNIIWNLIGGSVCLFTVLIDLLITGVNGITVFNTFVATLNIGCYIIFRLQDKYAKCTKDVSEDKNGN